MRICLVSDIPYKLIDRRLEYPVKRNGEFNDTQSRAEVATSLSNSVKQKVPQLMGELWELFRGQFPQVCRLLNLIEERCFRS